MESAAHLQPEPDDIDSLANLEERILRTVEVVNTLRSERDEAISELTVARKAATNAVAESQRMKAELDELRGERKKVRTRIEKLLGQMDLLSGA